MNSSPRWLAFGVLIVLIGCGKTQMPASQLRNAETAYSEAVDALQEKDYATALERFNAAIDEGGLNPDMFADALLRSAECHIELGNLEDAAGVLDSLEANAPELDQFHLVRCKLYSKQGDIAKARAAFQAAREINPTVELPVTLN
jgi:tetratricopeptide (TPR) repeat protein